MSLPSPRTWDRQLIEQHFSSPIRARLITWGFPLEGKVKDYIPLLFMFGKNENARRKLTNFFLRMKSGFQPPTLLQENPLEEENANMMEYLVDYSMQGKIEIHLPSSTKIQREGPHRILC